MSSFVEDPCDQADDQAQDDYFASVVPEPTGQGGPHRIVLSFEWFGPVAMKYTEVWTWNGTGYEKQ